MFCLSVWYVCYFIVRERYLYLYLYRFLISPFLWAKLLYKSGCSSFKLIAFTVIYSLPSFTESYIYGTFFVKHRFMYDQDPIFSWQQVVLYCQFLAWKDKTKGLLAAKRDGRKCIDSFSPSTVLQVNVHKWSQIWGGVGGLKWP